MLRRVVLYKLTDLLEMLTADIIRTMMQAVWLEVVILETKRVTSGEQGWTERRFIYESSSGRHIRIRRSFGRFFVFKVTCPREPISFNLLL
jgi:hypothetical protein